jgi:hypothetical protein
MRSRAVASALRQIDRGRLRHGGGELRLLGLGGAVFALSELGLLWADPALISAARELAATMTPLIDRDEEFAVMDGTAGALLGLGALAQTGSVGGIDDIVRRATDHLLAAQGATTGHAAWLPRQMREAGLIRKPLAGYGHGASGIASALVRATEILKDESYCEAALRATDYERELFDVERNNWRDIRELSVPDGLVVEKHGDWTATEGNSIAWCHGAVGIGLTRFTCCVTATRHEFEPIWTRRWRRHCAAGSVTGTPCATATSAAWNWLSRLPPSEPMTGCGTVYAGMQPRSSRTSRSTDGVAASTAISRYQGYTPGWRASVSVRCAWQRHRPGRHRSPGGHWRTCGRVGAHGSPDSSAAAPARGHAHRRLGPMHATALHDRFAEPVEIMAVSGGGTIALPLPLDRTG